MIRLMAPHFSNVATHAQTNTMKLQQQITIKTGEVKQHLLLKWLISRVLCPICSCGISIFDL